MKGMKMVGKTQNREDVKRFLDQVYYAYACETGNSRACIAHYYAGREEVASVSYNFDSKTYILRIAK
jgi:hypothetical protein